MKTAARENRDQRGEGRFLAARTRVQTDKNAGRLFFPRAKKRRVSPSKRIVARGRVSAATRAAEKTAEGTRCVWKKGARVLQRGLRPFLY